MPSVLPNLQNRVKNIVVAGDFRTVQPYTHLHTDYYRYLRSAPPHFEVGLFEWSNRRPSLDEFANSLSSLLERPIMRYHWRTNPHPIYHVPYMLVVFLHPPLVSDLFVPLVRMKYGVSSMCTDIILANMGDPPGYCHFRRGNTGVLRSTWACRRHIMSAKATCTLCEPTIRLLGLVPSSLTLEVSRSYRSTYPAFDQICWELGAQSW